MTPTSTPAPVASVAVGPSVIAPAAAAAPRRSTRGSAASVQAKDTMLAPRPDTRKSSRSGSTQATSQGSFPRSRDVYAVAPAPGALDTEDVNGASAAESSSHHIGRRGSTRSAAASEPFEEDVTPEHVGDQELDEVGINAQAEAGPSNLRARTPPQPTRKTRNGISSTGSSPLSWSSPTPPPAQSRGLTSGRSKVSRNIKSKGKERAPRPATPNSARPARATTSAQKPEKRVLPARIRRAAGGGAEGIRDLEEMIVDWLERWGGSPVLVNLEDAANAWYLGAPTAGPPDDLPIYLSTLPLSLIHPPPTSFSHPPPTPVTITPTKPSIMVPPPSPRLAFPLTSPRLAHGATHGALISPSPRKALLDPELRERIETPSWHMVAPGEDDMEEAQDELMTHGRQPTSPVKRLRRLPDSEDDTSDAYYISQHRKYEVFERRQRIREKEKLVFERYKMKSRIDLLKNMSDSAWSAIVATVLSRSSTDTKPENGAQGGDPGEDAWHKGREKLAHSGHEWLRSRLVKEGKELVKRYDQLLPSDTKKTASNGRAQTTPTPERYLETPSPSMSPAPSRPSTVLPARVTALRKNTSSSRRRSLPSSSTAKPEETGRSTRSGDSRSRSRAVTDSPGSDPHANKRSASQEQKELLPNLKRRKTILNSLDLVSPQKSSRQDQPSKPMTTRANGTNGACGVSTEDALEMREVEAAVVL